LEYDVWFVSVNNRALIGMRTLVTSQRDQYRNEFTQCSEGQSLADKSNSNARNG